MSTWAGLGGGFEVGISQAGGMDRNSPYPLMPVVARKH